MRATVFNIHDLLTLQLASERKGAHAFFGDELAHFRATSANRPDIRMTVGPLSWPEGKALLFDNRKYAVWEDGIAFSVQYKAFRMRLQWSGLQQAETMLHFDGHPLAYRLLFLKFLIPVIRLRLLRRGFTLVKASAIGRQGKAWLIPAWSGGGKTSLVLHALEQGFLLWSDTFSLVSQQGEVYPFPRPLHVFWRNVVTNPSLWERLSNKDKFVFRLKQLIHVLSLRTYNLSQRLSVGDEMIGQSPARLHAVLFLSQTNQSSYEVSNLSADHTASKMVANDRHEARLFDAAYLAYAHSQPGGRDYWQSHSEIVTAFLDSVTCKEISLPLQSQPGDFECVLNEHMV
jgi:hypothetical protein